MMPFNNILDKNPQLKQQWQQTIDEIKTNQRLRIGFWLVLGILFFYIGMLISDSNQQSNKQLAQAKQREIKAIHLAKETHWSERAIQTQLALYQLQTKFDDASTQGVAKATLQGLINKLIEQVGLEKTRVRISDAEDIESELPLWSFVVSVDGTFKADSLENLLYHLSTHPKHLSVESLEILPNLSRFRMKIKYWFANSSELSRIKNELITITSKQIKSNPKDSQKALTESEIESLKNGFPSEIFQ